MLLKYERGDPSPAGIELSLDEPWSAENHRRSTVFDSVGLHLAQLSFGPQWRRRNMQPDQEKTDYDMSAALRHFT